MWEAAAQIRFELGSGATIQAVNIGTGGIVNWLFKLGRVRSGPGQIYSNTAIESLLAYGLFMNRPI